MHYLQNLPKLTTFLLLDTEWHADGTEHTEGFRQWRWFEEADQVHRRLWTGRIDLDQDLSWRQTPVALVCDTDFHFMLQRCSLVTGCDEFRVFVDALAMISMCTCLSENHSSFTFDLLCSELLEQHCSYLCVCVCVCVCVYVCIWQWCVRSGCVSENNSKCLGEMLWRWTELQITCKLTLKFLLHVLHV